MCTCRYTLYQLHPHIHYMCTCRYTLYQLHGVTGTVYIYMYTCNVLYYVGVTYTHIYITCVHVDIHHGGIPVMGLSTK